MTYALPQGGAQRRIRNIVADEATESPVCAGWHAPACCALRPATTWGAFGAGKSGHDRPAPATAAPMAVTALLAIAGDRKTRSPVQLAEAGPWWLAPPAPADDDQDELADFE